MNVAVAPGSPAAAISRRIRVMIVDDAVVVRGLFARWVEAESDLEVVATLRTGREALNQIERVDPDVAVLDIDMPELDGLTALPLLLEKKRDLVVIMASTLTRRNAEVSLKALSLGAADYIPKPSSNREVAASSSFRRDLIEKIRQLGQRAKRLRLNTAARPQTPPTARQFTIEKSGFAAPSIVPAQAPGAAPTAPAISLRPMPVNPPRVLLIGASTGGPQALNTLIPKIGAVIDRAPVLITQHMPPTFTTILGEHLSRLTGRPAREAQHGEEVNAGTIYIAPGNRHMRIERRDGTATIALEDGALINFCKPAVDPMFASAAQVWGHWVMGVVLTGMGSDGLRGAKSIVAAGGSIIAQDEASSVVWGMPGQVSMAGVCSAVLPINDIAPRLTRIFTGDRQ